MSNCLRRIRSSRGFSIDRRRDSKSGEIFSTKRISTKYIKQSSHEDIIENDQNRLEIIQFKREKEEIKILNEIIVYDTQKVIDKFLSIVLKFNI